MNQLLTLSFMLFFLACVHGQWLKDPKLDGVKDPQSNGVKDPQSDGVNDPESDGVDDPQSWGEWGKCDGKYKKKYLGTTGRWKAKPCMIFNPSGGSPKTAAEKSCLKMHNMYRARHGKPPLIWDSKIQASAQRWARHIAGLGYLQHTSGGKYGENLASTSESQSPKNLLGGEAVKRWYDEICIYNSCGFGGGTGHFTQVIWGESKYVGCALHKASNGFTYTVAQYAPAGNMQIEGEFKKNVGCPGDPMIVKNRQRTCDGSRPKKTGSGNSGGGGGSSYRRPSSVRRPSYRQPTYYRRPTYRQPTYRYYRSYRQPTYQYYRQPTYYRRYGDEMRRRLLDEDYRKIQPPYPW